MLAATYGTIEDIEILWTLLAMGGLGLASVLLYSAYGDYRAVKRQGIRNGRRVLAVLAVQTETLRAVIQAIFLAIGVAAMFVPSPVGDRPHSAVVVGILIRWGLIVASVCLSYKSYLTWRARKRILEED